MSALAVIVVLAFVALWVLKSTGKNVKKENRPKAKTKPFAPAAAIAKAPLGRKVEVAARLPDIPSGHQIYAERLGVAGIFHHKAAAQQFVRGSGQSLVFEREVDNPHDKNAFLVVGLTATGRHRLGYVPATMAEQIVGSGLEAYVQPRLEYGSERADGYIDIVFQVVGPEGKLALFRDYPKNKPARADHKDFYKFFMIPVPRGLTAGQAEETITTLEEHLREESSPKLADWESYCTICDEIDDEDFGANYGIKKVSRAVLRQALDALVAEGKSLQNVEDNIQNLVDKIIAIKPALQRADA